MAISEDDVTRFLLAKAIKPCASCGQAGTFRLNGGANLPGLTNVPVELRITAIDERQGATKDGFHAFYSMTCDNCGFTNFHHVNQISRWLRENPKGGKTDGGS